MGFQNSVACADQQISRYPFVVVDQATKNRSTFDPFMTEVCHGVGWSRRAKFAGAVRSSTVVVPDVFREHHMQVPLTEDQYPVGEFGSNRTDEPFGETIRPRTARRNLHNADADVSKNRIEGRGELTCSISNKEPELGDAIAKIHHQIADLLRRPVRHPHYHRNNKNEHRYSDAISASRFSLPLARQRLLAVTQRRYRYQFSEWLSAVKIA